MQPMTITRITALLLALTLVNCAQNPVTGNPNLVLVSESQEIAIGKREDANVRKQYSVYDDAPLQLRVITAQPGAHVRRSGAALAARKIRRRPPARHQRPVPRG